MTSYAAGKPRRHVTWDFSDEVVLITGAAHGQGRNHALSFARAGANLALSDLEKGISSVVYDLGTQEELNQVADECRALGAKVVTRPCDVRDPQAVEEFVNAAVEEFGRIDIAVAQAGIASIVDIVDMSETQWDELVDTNLKGVFLTFKFAAKAMIATGTQGRLVATGSLNSFVGYPMNGHYTAAKHGVAGLCKAMAQEVAEHKIRVNFVAPTAIDTPMANQMLLGPDVPEGYPERLGALTGPFNLLDDDGGMLDPEEITQAIMWLASDSSRYVTGTHIAVDAGFLTK